jgi:hypothetical protein
LKEQRRMLMKKDLRNFSSVFNAVEIFDLPGNTRELV